MNMQAPFTFASVVSLGVWHLLGLRVRAFTVVLGELLVFFASSPYSTRASSSGFRSPWSVLSRLFCCVGSARGVGRSRRGMTRSMVVDYPHFGCRCGASSDVVVCCLWSDAKVSA